MSQTLENNTASAASAASTAVHPHAAARIGLAYGVGAYLWWGFVPLYFRAVRHVPAIQVLAHRVVWSLLFVLLLTAFAGGWGELRRAMRHRRTLIMLAASTAVLSINWFTFIWAVAQGIVIQASLGYFINPLVSVLLGMVFLRERLRAWQAVGLALAVVGVLYMTWSRGQVPWVALVLAASFGLYGLLRKTAPVGAMPGLTIETALLLLPAAAIIVIYQGAADAPRLDWGTHGLLVLAGVVTAIPLLFFAAAARRLRLATIGFLQYLGPTCQFLLAVYAFGEPFGRDDLISFTLIWSALLLYSWDSIRAYRGAMAAVPAPAAEP